MKKIILLLSVLLTLTACSADKDKEVGDIATELPPEIVDRENSINTKDELEAGIWAQLKENESTRNASKTVMLEPTHGEFKQSVFNINETETSPKIHVLIYLDKSEDYNKIEENGFITVGDEQLRAYVYKGSIAYISSGDDNQTLVNIIESVIK